ncbi:hypothetical protein C2845_PM01G02100 [Panicum miliaceum]|uniref:Uncharacterized protein n=1 Tax=Panicum miliaceum TaxID=4540 RepID=A0A3L6TG59_PANMI|nr:hypothetical protein C2845_PM01G02100 [Panicum miliaceum]
MDVADGHGLPPGHLLDELLLVLDGRRDLHVTISTSVSAASPPHASGFVAADPQWRAVSPLLGRSPCRSERGIVLPASLRAPSCSVHRRLPVPGRGGLREALLELLPFAGDVPLRFVLVAVGLDLVQSLDAVEHWWRR